MHLRLFAAALVVASIAASGCKTSYPVCTSDKECHADESCVAGKCQLRKSDSDRADEAPCAGGACKPGPGLCDTTDDCAAGEECREGHCVAPSAGHAPCAAQSVYFDFNETTLTTDATTTLFNALPCLKATTPLVASGHADPRGTAEYNLALSDRRARAVRDHLGRLGVDANHVQVLPRGDLDATGQDEPTWAKDRRVDLSLR